MPILNADYSNLNYDEIASEIGLKPKHMPMLIGSFVDEASEIMQNLKGAIDAKEYANIKMHAHLIKGSAGNLKFREIYDMAREIELAAMESKADFDYMTYFDAINKIIATIKP